MCIVYEHNKINVCYTDFACWFNLLQMWLVQVVIFLGTLSDLHYTHIIWIHMYLGNIFYACSMLFAQDLFLFEYF